MDFLRIVQYFLRISIYLRKQMVLILEWPFFVCLKGTYLLIVRLPPELRFLMSLVFEEEELHDSRSGRSSARLLVACSPPQNFSLRVAVFELDPDRPQPTALSTATAAASQRSAASGASGATAERLLGICEFEWNRPLRGPQRKIHNVLTIPSKRQLLVSCSDGFVHVFKLPF